jgi:hypothetical protein
MTMFFYDYVNRYNDNIKTNNNNNNNSNNNNNNNNINNNIARIINNKQLWYIISN